MPIFRKPTRTSLLPIFVILEGVVVVILIGIVLFLFLSNRNMVASFIGRGAPVVAGSLRPSLVERDRFGTMAAATLEVVLPKVTAAAPTLAPTPTPEPPTRMPTQTPTQTATPTPLAPLGRIVFTCTPEAYNQLCIMNADGSGYERLTSRSTNDYYPSFAPDGESVVFVSNQTQQFEVFILDLMSHKETQVTDELSEGLGSPTAPEFSPDGRWIVFALKQWSNSSIWVIQRDGRNALALTDEQYNEIDPTWSPDGKQIAFAGVRNSYVELFVMDADGNHIRQVTHGVLGIGGRSSWSPDGKRLVFYAGPQGDRDIYVVEIATGEVNRLTVGGNNTGPCFSPDGQWIVFSSSRDGDHEIYIMRTDGSDVRQLTSNDFDDWQPRWGL